MLAVASRQPPQNSGARAGRKPLGDVRVKIIVHCQSEHSHATIDLYMAKRLRSAFLPLNDPEISHCTLERLCQESKILLIVYSHSLIFIDLNDLSFSGDLILLYNLTRRSRVVLEILYYSTRPHIYNSRRSHATLGDLMHTTLL
jgi:hypothetical protein